MSVPCHLVSGPQEDYGTSSHKESLIVNSRRCNLKHTNLQRNRLEENCNPPSFIIPAELSINPYLNLPTVYCLIGLR